MSQHRPAGPPAVVRDRLVDVGLAVLTAAPGFLPFAQETSRYRLATIGILLVQAVVVFLARRLHPFVLLGVGVAGFAAAVSLESATPAFVTPIALALYSLAAQRGRAISIPVTAVTAVLLPLLGLTVSVVRVGVSPGLVLDSRLLLLPAIVAAAAAVGDAQRSRRAYLDELTDRALRAEREKETEAQRRLVEERLRIARDLHDAVAHQITVINLHAGVASATLRRSPDAAERALSTVREAGRTVLREIGDLMTMLRDSSAEEPPAAPHTLDDIDALLRRFGAEGAGVWASGVRTLPEAVGIVAYRVIQEGLLNAQKHGDGTPARVTTEVEAGEALSIRIENAAGPAGPGSGFGLIGVRERVGSVRGSVRFGPTSEGTFLLSIRLPFGPRGELPA